MTVAHVSNNPWLRQDGELFLVAAIIVMSVTLLMVSCEAAFMAGCIETIRAAAKLSGVPTSRGPPSGED